MNDLIAAFERVLNGMDGMPFGIWDLAAWTIFGLVAIPALFFGLWLFAHLAVGVMQPVVAATTAADRKRDADHLAEVEDKAREVTYLFFEARRTRNYTEFRKASDRPDHVREPTPAGEVLVSSTAPILALVAVVAGILGVVGLILWAAGKI